MSAQAPQITQVTLSDCGKALDTIEREIEDLKRRKVAIQRKIDALLTQGLLIKQLVRFV